jgi:DNA invertase Pin-like site-specific DNA recombinase
MTVYGYARVSTQDQDLGGQVTELLAAGCNKIFQEKVSGIKSDRSELSKLLKGLQEGDLLIVTRLDRLARSTRDLLNVIDTRRQVRWYGNVRHRERGWQRQTPALSRFIK